MKRRRVYSAVVGILILIAIFAVGVSAQAQDKVIRFKYAAFSSPAHPNAALAANWCREIEKRTNGRVKITYYPGGTLITAPQIYDSVVKGIVDIGQGVLAHTPGRMPLTEVIDLPLGYKSGLQATRLINAYFKAFSPKEFEDTKILYLHAHGPAIVHTKKPVAGINELKGMRLKCTGLNTNVVQAIGAIPVAIPTAETYDALQKGLLDGVVLPTESLKSYRFADHCMSTLQNYGTAFSTGFFVAMNKDKWKSLPKDIQKVFEQASSEWIDKTGAAWEQADKDAEAFALTKGHKFVIASKEETAETHKKMKPIFQDYVTRMKAKGLPGEAALEFCLNYLRTNP